MFALAGPDHQGKEAGQVPTPADDTGRRGCQQEGVPSRGWAQWSRQSPPCVAQGAVRDTRVAGTLGGVAGNPAHTHTPRLFQEA